MAIIKSLCVSLCLLPISLQLMHKPSYENKLEQLLRNPALDVNKCYWNSRKRPLALVVKNDRLNSFVIRILDRGGRIDFEDLVKAVKHKAARNLETLLSRLDKKTAIEWLNVDNRYKYNPFEKAVMWPGLNCIKICLFYGADPNQPYGSFRRTLLHRVIAGASTRYAPEVLKELCIGGGSPDMRSDGQSPIEMLEYEPPWAASRMRPILDVYSSKKLFSILLKLKTEEYRSKAIKTFTSWLPRELLSLICEYRNGQSFEDLKPQEMEIELIQTH